MSRGEFQLRMGLTPIQGKSLYLAPVHFDYFQPWTNLGATLSFQIEVVVCFHASDVA